MREDIRQGVSPNFGGIWRPGVGALCCILAPALRLRPLASLGRRENTATRLEGPKGSDVDTAPHARVESC